MKKYKIHAERSEAGKKLSVMHSLRLSGEILCQNFLVHPKCTLGGSTKYHTFRGGGGGLGFLMLSPNL